MVEITRGRCLGHSDVEVTPLGFGGNVLGNLYAAVEEDAALDTVAAAYETGVRYFDTAPLYGHGLSEHRMGHALRRYERPTITLSTKVGRLLKPHGKVAPPRLAPSQGGIFADELPFQPEFDYSYAGTIRSIEDSLQRLGMNRIDVALIHDADQWTHKDGYEELIEEVRTGALPALQDLKEEGVIRAFGAGVNQAEACERLMDIGQFDCFLLAGRYTLLEQDALDRFLPRCIEENVSIILGAPFNSGILATGAIAEARYNYLPAPQEIRTRVEGIERLCQAHGVTLAAAALQFPLAHPAILTVIPGARSRAEAERNGALIKEAIPAGFWSDLKTEGLVRSDAPLPA
ncbi:MAG: D-threo-aldose 1-dehydrogenase [Rhodospirillaceae bacterium]|jgi:D-threo-aldose 1-dehydrogenase|nr:D-threo-aldose 1-dehydrogenase [Rhodospirillaceae bacterium]